MINHTINAIYITCDKP